MTFEFQPSEHGTLSDAEAVFQALGAASTCWESLEGTGTFDSDRAKLIGDKLLEHVARPRLGYATTEQLLDELRARIEVHGPGLDYATVGDH